MRVVLTLLVVAPLAVAAPVPKALKAKLPDYYPLTDGTTWEYEMGSTTVTVRVTDYKEKDGVRTGKLVTEHAGKTVASETIRVDADGVARTHLNDTEIKPAIFLLKFGLTDEEGWEVKANSGGAAVTAKFTLKGTEKAKVPAGEYQVVVVKGETSVSGMESVVTYRLAEGVGIVRMEFDLGGTASSTFELKKYTPGKAK